MRSPLTPPSPLVFLCDHLLDPQGDEAEPAPRRNILFALSLPGFLKPIWERVGTFEMSFHSKMGALISPLLRLVKKSHKRSMRIPAWLTRFYLPRILSSGVQSRVCRRSFLWWRRHRRCDIFVDVGLFSSRPENTKNRIIVPLLLLWKIEIFKNLNI